VSESIDYLDRTVALLDSNGTSSSSRALTSLLAKPCFVLLAEPGMGKTSVFKAMATMQAAKYITANDLLIEDEFDGVCAEHPLYIDALDEARAADGTGVLSAVRKKLRKFKISNFRLACRAADWNSGTDNEDIAYLAADEKCPAFVLEPLDDSQIRKVAKIHGVDDVGTFLKKIDDARLGEILGNPQSLFLLTAVFKDDENQLPESSSELLSVACDYLLKEVNRRHQKNHPQESLYQAAGWLCAVLLLSNNERITFEQQDSASISGTFSFLDLNLTEDLSPNEDVIRAIVKRRLFKSDRGNYAPVHRTVAEFLAARYLNDRMNKGLIPSRLLSLFLIDGKALVSNLRGLTGQLYTICKSIRQPLLSVDPHAILMYGNLEQLEVSYRRELIQALSLTESFSYSFNLLNRAAAFGPLAAEDMHDFLQSWLRDFSNQAKNFSVTESQETVARIVLTALKTSKLSTNFATVLDTLIRNETLKKDIRERALLALNAGFHGANAFVQRIANDINSRRVSDLGSVLLDCALEKLYPTIISPDEIFDYAATAYKNNPRSYRPDFFNFFFKELTGEEHLLSLASALAQRYADYDFYTQPDRAEWRTDLPARDLITRAILRFGTQVATTTLSLWLQLALDLELGGRRSGEAEGNKRNLASWQNNNPKLVMDVVALRLDSPQHYWMAAWFVISEQVKAKLGQFWLEQAVKKSKHRPDVSEFCLRQAVLLLEKYCDTTDISLDDIFRRLESDAFLNERLSTMLVSNLESDDIQFVRRQAQYLNEQTIRKERERKKLEAHFVSLESNLEKIKAAQLMNYLNDAAWADLQSQGLGYLGNEHHSTISERLQINPLLRQATDDGYVSSLQHLVELDLQTIRKCRLEKNLIKIELPSLLGAEMLFNQDRSKFFQLNEQQLEFLLIFSFNQQVTASWRSALARARPDFFCLIWITHADWTLKKTQSDVPFLLSLIADADYKDAAKLALPKLLLKFPKKYANRYLNDFLILLDGVVKHCEAIQVSALLNQWLNKKSINAIQRTHLLMAGLFVDPNKFRPMIERRVNEGLVQPNLMLGFISHFKSSYLQDIAPTFAPESLSPCAAGFVIQSIAPLCNPSGREGEGYFTRNQIDDGRDFVSKLMASLSSDFSGPAGEILEQLQNVDLGGWNSVIKSSSQFRMQKKLNAEFNNPSPNDVISTLSGGRPANHADLKATATELLGQYQSTLRNSDLNQINSFWIVNRKTGKPTDQYRTEPECRDIVAQWLRASLERLGVTLSPEALHGNQKRSDFSLQLVRAGKPEIRLPFEVKGDWHSEVLTAATTQLYDRYATEPRAAGHGVYLVLWTGKHNKRDYQTPLELEQLLTAKLRADSKYANIRIFVLDVSHNADATRKKP
jgi:hypothetical protein